MRFGAPLVFSVWSWLVAGAPGQESSVSVRGPDPAVVKLGDAAEAVVTVSGSHDAEILRTPEVAGLAIRVGPPQQSSYLVSDGRGLKQTLSLSWSVRLTPEREGKFEVPPIDVRVGRSTFSTKPMRLEAARDLKGQEYAFLEVSTRKRTYFVHEPIHISVRYGIDQRILRNLLQIANMEVQVPVQIRATWLSELPGAVAFERRRTTDPPGERYKVFINDNAVEEAAHVGTVERDGRTFESFELEKDYLPGRIGELEFSKPTLFFRYVTRWGNDIFRQRVPAEAENAFVYGKAIALTIKPIPEEGRPADYTGGVGEFRLSADAAPKDLKVGESLKLTLTIEGEGNLEFLDPPRLDELDGFHVFGKIEEKGRSRRTITYDLSPLSEKVTRIPAISLSYFDTSVPGFKRVSTAPIPLAVRPLPEGAQLRPLPGESSKRAVPGVDDILDMKPVAGTPLAPGRPGTGLAALLIFGPWLGAGAFWALIRKRERDSSDPARVRARNAAANFRRTVMAGGADPFDAFARYLADRLACPPAAVIADDLAARLQARGIEAGLAGRAADALHSHVEARYAGSGGVTARAEEFARLVDELETAFRRGR